MKYEYTSNWKESPEIDSVKEEDISIQEVIAKAKELAQGYKILIDVCEDNRLFVYVLDSEENDNNKTVIDDGIFIPIMIIS